MFSDRRVGRCRLPPGAVVVEPSRTSPSGSPPPGSVRPARGRTAGRDELQELPARQSPRRKEAALAGGLAHPAAGVHRRYASTRSRRSATCDPACTCSSPTGRRVRASRGRGGRGRATTTGPVYDLEVDPTHTYVADGVLVHNSIYRFRGADIAQHPRVRGGVPRRHGDPARAELPLDPDHPRRGQRGHRQQHGPQAQGALDRPGRRRGHRALPRRRRGRRGAVGGPPDVEAARRSATTRWGDMAVFYRTNAQSRVLEELAHAGRHPVQGHRRHPLLRPARGQGRAGLPAGGREPGRRGVGQAGAQRPEAGRGRQHRRPARRLRHRPRLHVLRDACAGPTTPG